MKKLFPVFVLCSIAVFLLCCFLMYFHFQKAVAEPVSLKIENISEITCSIDLEYPARKFSIPAEVVNYIETVLKTQMSSARAVKGAPLFSFDTVCKDNTTFKVQFLVIDDGDILVQCNEKKFLGKMKCSDFRKFFEFLGKINPSIAESVLSSPIIQRIPYSDLNIPSRETNQSAKSQLP